MIMIDVYDDDDDDDRDRILTMKNKGMHLR